jgi:hypothetical protein
MYYRALWNGGCINYIGLSSVVYQNKKPVLLLSIYAISIGHPYMPMPMVPKKKGVVWQNIMTFFMNFDYTTHMLGVNVADQL